MGEPFIKVENLSYIYEEDDPLGAPVLKDLSLEINKGIISITIRTNITTVSSINAPR